MTDKIVVIGLAGIPVGKKLLDSLSTSVAVIPVESPPPYFDNRRNILDPKRNFKSVNKVPQRIKRGRR